MAAEEIDLDSILNGLTPLIGRTPETEIRAEDNVFATLGKIAGAGIFIGSFQGDSAWERHPNGNEMVQILRGATVLSILTENGRRDLHLTAGMMTIVPQGAWHKFHAPDGVSVMTVTPQPTDHARGELPPPPHSP